MSDEIIKPSTTFNDCLAPPLAFIDTKTRVKSDGSCLKQNIVTYTLGKTVNICFDYEINSLNYASSSDPTLPNSLFCAVKLLKMLILINTNILDMVFDLTWNELFHVKSNFFW